MLPITQDMRGSQARRRDTCSFRLGYAIHILHASGSCWPTQSAAKPERGIRDNHPIRRRVIRDQTRRSYRTLIVAPMTNAQSKVFDSVPIVPSISIA